MLLSVLIRGSKHVVATRTIRAGEYLYRVCAPVAPTNKTPFRDDHMMGPYLAHCSTTPNAYVNAIDILVAGEDIAKGHEITVNRKPRRSIFKTQIYLRVKKPEFVLPPL